MRLLDVHKILKPIIEKERTLSIVSIVDNAPTYDVTVECGTSYLTKGKKVQIDNNSYRVTKLEGNVITLTGNTTPVGTLLTLPQVYYWHGTIKQTDNERINVPNRKDKTPFVYLFETIRESYSNSDSNYIEIPLRMFFLDESSFSDYTTELFYDEVIYPMRALAEEIINDVDSMANDLENIEVINHTRFATFMDSQGYEKNAISEELTGVEVRLNALLPQDINCKC